MDSSLESTLSAPKEQGPNILGINSQVNQTEWIMQPGVVIVTLFLFAQIERIFPRRGLEKRRKSMKYLLITNNPLVGKIYGDSKFLLYLEGSYLEVLCYARDQIHKGHELLSHPLSGSIKPNETPYKSLLISSESKTLDYRSVTMIEESIVTTKKFLSIRDRTQGLREDLLKDFQEIDYHLIKSALESAN